MPSTRSQSQSETPGLNGTFIQPTPSQLKARLYGLDLDNYVPLGSFPTSPPSQPGVDVENSNLDGVEVTDNRSLLLPEPKSLAEDLNLLLTNHWIRIVVRQTIDLSRTILRVYVLPDDIARELVIRNTGKLRSALRNTIYLIDCSPETWNLSATTDANDNPQRYISPADVTDSLYYLFNNVTSPDPDPESLEKIENYYAVLDILQQPLSLGLKTSPFEYQRHSAAAMLLREAEPQKHMDPRFEKRQGPTGDDFFLDCIEGTIDNNVKLYENVRGGILGENMGSGKTLISILLILATKGHAVRIPKSHVSSYSFEKERPGLGSRTLLEIAARAIREQGVPCKVELQKSSPHLVKVVQEVEAWYIPSQSRLELHLSSTTLIVVPPNLIAHWTDEISKHVISGQLSIYTSVNDDADLPPLQELLTYDIILISKTRFENEFDPRLSNKRMQDTYREEGYGAVCTCKKKRRACARHLYVTALLQISFLRVIVDEALGFSKSEFDNKASAALQKVVTERKWLVSGTPSKGLRGVEIDMAMNQDHVQAHDHFERETLENRRARPTMETEEQQVKRFGSIVTNFFRAKPWADEAFGFKSEMASWSRYMIPDKDGKGKAGNLKAVVESLVVRHQMHEVGKEVCLPPLSNRIVYLDACPVDKMALNLFTLQLIINYITSEKEDQDYMFHPKQKTALAKLFQNLRHANFYWTGLDWNDLFQALETAKRYAAKDTTHMSAADEVLLKEAIAIGSRTLKNIQWQRLSNSKEMGLFVKDFPLHLREKWALASLGYRQPLLMSANNVQKTQEEVAPGLYTKDPFEKLLTAEGLEIQRDPSKDKPEEKKSKGAAAVKGISQSSYDTADSHTTKRRRSIKPKIIDPVPPPVLTTSSGTGVKSALKRRSPGKVSLPQHYAELSKPSLVATSSTKLSYLIDKIIEVQKDEKSIIFYEDTNTGYWIAQALEILEIKHEIYAFGIKEAQRSEYLRTFEAGEHIRVLLMDLRLSSHGLHLASVTRVFFVNPVWDETVEAQAIKRAHRTGQTRPVYIETLVLKGTLEDQMLRRRKNMTSQELQQTSKGPTSDPEMHAIIKNVAFLPMSEEEWTNEQLQCAPLKKSHQVYGREFINHPSLLTKASPPLPAADSMASSTSTRSDAPVPLIDIQHDRDLSESSEQTTTPNSSPEPINANGQDNLIAASTSQSELIKSRTTLGKSIHKMEPADGSRPVKKVKTIQWVD